MSGLSDIRGRPDSATRSAASDPFIGRLRREIADNDRRIVEAINTRLELVSQMRRYKDSRGIPFHDPDREDLLLRFLEDANLGPLSREGLEEIVQTLLEVTKRELRSRRVGRSP
jgi:chorismate mutase